MAQNSIGRELVWFILNGSLVLRTLQTLWLRKFFTVELFCLEIFLDTKINWGGFGTMNERHLAAKVFSSNLLINAGVEG